MLIGIICFISICYGIVGCFRLWKQHAKSDAIVLLLFCGAIAGYFIPVISDAWPTVESMYIFLYKPVSTYMFEHVLKIKLEDF